MICSNLRHMHIERKSVQACNMKKVQKWWVHKVYWLLNILSNVRHIHTNPYTDSRSHHPNCHLPVGNVNRNILTLMAIWGSWPTTFGHADILVKFKNQYGTNKSHGGHIVNPWQHLIDNPVYCRANNHFWQSPGTINSSGALQTAWLKAFIGWPLFPTILWQSWCNTMILKECLFHKMSMCIHMYMLATLMFYLS